MTPVVPPPPIAPQSTGMPQTPLESQTPVRRADASSRGRGLRAAALAALCLAELLVVIDNTIVNVAIPSLVISMHQPLGCSGSLMRTPWPSPACSCLQATWVTALGVGVFWSSGWPRSVW